ncbi:unnamed protein product [Phyllotreta striolata]|uniref:Glycoside hydrolase family 31 n=1 Tax=Phyllotreta striolata TaxID=444603 RepID=A0A9N9TPR4_PHYSR|nr:unnamed protein product [Phyllotreta striolata]
MIKTVILSFLVYLIPITLCDVTNTLIATEKGLKVLNYNDNGRATLTGMIGDGRNFMNLVRSPGCKNFTNCIVDENTSLSIKPINKTGYRVTWISTNTTSVFRDCYDLNSETTNWFGGPERYVQNSLEELTLDGDSPYIIKKSDNFAIAERYWLNSRGTFIFVHDIVPLFVEQRSLLQVCFIAKSIDPYINRNRTVLEYDVITKSDSKEAHLFAVNNYLGKPTGHPNEKMIRNPIWTTWPKYKKYIDDDKVREFAKSIAAHNFSGQLEIDEDWEVCFGSHVFNKAKFPNISSTVDYIKSLGFGTVTLWINPFVNNDCQNYSKEGLEKGYFVKNPKGDTKAIWWESDDAHQVDFTNPNAAEWFADKVRALAKDPGMDGFKFDAGETDYAIPPSQFDYIADQEQVPNIFTTKYVETCSQFGDLIEVRAGWRTQHLPMFVRMIDKDCVWSYDDGLQSLVTTLIQMNMNGYTMVLPDMVGGNGYRAQPTSELLVRWTQANALMPALQFGYLPWDYPSDTYDIVEIVRKFANLHTEYADKIIKAMEASIKYGTPVNPPIWWVDPTDPKAFTYDDEFLLGEDVLVAPVLLETVYQRNIYLPSGTWKDGNNGTIYEGPVVLEHYDAPIDVLPYFIKQN